MSIALSNAAANAALDAFLALLNSGTLEVWTGAPPGSVGGSESGNTLLGTLSFSSTAFRAAGVAGPLGSGTQPATARRAYANTIASDTNADASGTAGHFVAKSSGAAAVLHGTAGQGTGDANFDVNVIVATGTIAVASMYLEM